MLSKYFTGIAVGSPAACFTESPSSECGYLAQEIYAAILGSSACDDSRESVKRDGMDGMGCSVHSFLEVDEEGCYAGNSAIGLS